MIPLVVSGLQQLRQEAVPKTIALQEAQSLAIQILTDRVSDTAQEASHISQQR